MIGRSPNYSSAAVQDLGLGSLLTDQVKDETDEARKKRLKDMQERELMGPGGSLASFSLLGTSGGSGAY